MMQQQQTSHWRIITYRIAKWAWLITVWIWTTIIIAFLAQYVPILLTTKTNDLQGTWTVATIHWLSTPINAPLEILRVIALGGTFLLVAIPPLAFLFKQMLQDVQREGFDRLIDILQQDTILPQLEVMQQQLQQQLEVQENCVRVLKQVHRLFQQTPTSSDLQGLRTLSQQQQQALQKDFSYMLHDLRYLQTQISEQMQRLADLSEQDQHAQKTISDGLAKIPPLLEEMQGNVKALSLSSDREHRSLSDRQTRTEPALAVVSPAQIDHLQDAVSA